MKTIEEKAKAYDELTAKLKEWHNGLRDGSPAKETLEYLLPQFRESEDEKIRKEIIDYFESRLSTAEEAEILYFKCWIAYLEKQKKIIDSITASRITIRPDGGIERSTIGYLEKQKGNQYFVGYAKGYSEGQLNPKQKEQKPVNDKAFEEWIDDWWKHNKVNNPDSYDKGDEIQFDERGFKNFCRGIRNMYQQNPAWSEEDESILNNIIAYRYLNVDDLEWIKKLPKRFNLQPKQEWSEEDIEAFVKSYSDSLPMYGEFQSYHDALVHAYRQGVVNTLKSLRPQPKQGKKGLILTKEQEKEFGHLFTYPSWKPTQEQIELLEKLSNHGGHYDYQNLELKKLVTQLKKL